jgi:hypothetical protein
MKLKGKEHGLTYSMKPILPSSPNQKTSKKENYRQISLMNINAKILNSISERSLTIIK